MRNIAFIVWLLLWPVVFFEYLAQTIAKSGFGLFVGFIIWILVAILSYDLPGNFKEGE